MPQTALPGQAFMVNSWVDAPTEQEKSFHGSMGGGIFVFEALTAASQMLLEAKAETRHIILFSDAADSEQSGRYQELLAHCREANISVSVVGLGTAGDVDAMLLEDIARLGEGNI